MHIKPSNINPETLGFLKTKQRVETKGGLISAYVKDKSEIISRTEKKRRDTMVRTANERFRFQELVREMYSLLLKEKPKYILMEANMAFRNIDVTRKLAEVAGALQALATILHIPLIHLNVHTVRANWDLGKEMVKFASKFTPKQLKSMDLTKETLKSLLLKKYHSYKLNSKMTTDESDSLVLLDHWLLNNKVNIKV